jgi:hypothetical protein
LKFGKFKEYLSMKKKIVNKYAIGEEGGGGLV